MIKTGIFAFVPIFLLCICMIYVYVYTCALEYALVLGCYCRSCRILMRVILKGKTYRWRNGLYGSFELVRSTGKNKVRFFPPALFQHIQRYFLILVIIRLTYEMLTYRLSFIVDFRRLYTSGKNIFVRLGDRRK